MRSIISLLLLSVLLLTANPVKVWANMANPVRAGQPVGEPSGDLKSIAIERESLTLDLRPLESESPRADIEAIYNLRNDGPQITTTLVFIADAMKGEERGVWLDEAPVPNEPSTAQDLPESWQPPRTTPAIGGGQPHAYEVRRTGSILFKITLTPGRHTLKVRYAATPTALSSDSPTIYWQLGYVLSPARQWASFGGLDTKVYLPHGWRAASEPALTRESDTLVGSWDNLPADALALTVQCPPSASWQAPLTLLAAIASLIICMLLGWLIGHGLGRRGRSSWWALPVSLVASVIPSLAVAFAYMAAPNGKQAAGNQAAWTYGYGDIFIATFFASLIWLLGLIVTQVAALIGRYRAAKKFARA